MTLRTRIADRIEAGLTWVNNIEAAALAWMADRIEPGITWMGNRIEAGIEATPWWVFVHGPRWIGSLLMSGLFFFGLLYGLQVALGEGVSMNPLTNMGKLMGHFEQSRAAATTPPSADD